MTDTWKEMKNKAKNELEEGRILFKKARRSLTQEQQQQARALFKELAAGIKTKDQKNLAAVLEKYDAFKESHFSQIRFNRAWETIKELFWIILVVFFIRWILVEPFRIPSGSMIPTLLVGDQLMVNKLVYGVQIPLTTKKLFNLKKPERGDVIVFKYPPNPREDYVKRVVGVAGDEITMRDGQLFVNGKEVPRSYVEPYTGPSDTGFCENYDLFSEELDHASHSMLLCHRSHQGEDFPAVIVPEGAVFGMGDNRDNSQDSRYWGMIPTNNIKGKALFIHLPLDPTRHYLPRWNRFFKWIR